MCVALYRSISAIAGGRSAGRAKMRTFEELDGALVALGSATVAGEGPIDDHSSDALLAAAWLRTVSNDAALWNPPGLDAVRHTEGWTFGAR